MVANSKGGQKREIMKKKHELADKIMNWCWKEWDRGSVAHRWWERQVKKKHRSEAWWRSNYKKIWKADES
jgi:hypothetical protein